MTLCNISGVPWNRRKYQSGHWSTARGGSVRLHVGEKLTIYFSIQAHRPYQAGLRMSQSGDSVLKGVEEVIDIIGSYEASRTCLPQPTAEQ